MAKKKTAFFCKECGYESPRWLGQCPGCKAWNSFIEELKSDISGASHGSIGKVLSGDDNHPFLLDKVSLHDEERLVTGISELDRVLGGGVVRGSLILIGGDPGIGKSTLLLQLCQAYNQAKQSILYVSGEESLKQIKLRANRLRISGDQLSLYTEVALERIEQTIMKQQPQVVMIDSIQTMFVSEMTSPPGSVSQVKEVTGRLLRIAKGMGITVFIVGHVTKEGAIAGPKVLEHMVDTVLYFEGEKNASYRLLRAVKNRFGGTNETGIFDMTGQGLVEVLNPSEYMLTGRPLEQPGSLVSCGIEGSRPFFVEVQALLTKMAFNMPRRTVNGYDYQRVMMLLAVMEKVLKIPVNQYDVYVNVAGGLRFNEPALDLGIAAALLSGYLDQAINPWVAVMGEIGLTGEIRGITFCERRIKEAKKLGFKTCIIPQSNQTGQQKTDGMVLHGIRNLRELKQVVF